MALRRSQMGATGTRMHIDMVEYDDAWQRVGGNSFQLDKSFFNPHDFGMTPNHYVFFQARFRAQRDVCLLGREYEVGCRLAEALQGSTPVTQSHCTPGLHARFVHVCKELLRLCFLGMVVNSSIGMRKEAGA